MKRLKSPAAEQMALHTTRLALARWSSGHSYVEALVAACGRPMPQARWHAGAQQHFLDWLKEGGFARHEQLDAINENSGNHAAVLMSHCGTRCEELKFSRVRISDAVE
ncbi:MAG: hypothetical protein V4724_33320 [Pseudomonadota bacterium]